ncbi:MULTISPECIES: bifunctional 23S rRNA (guanine(2069)-N(7))-methyltransferase RlmK/23S rRNA (guanine(2445)-N(2))-methyltransferase RlmL [unclassified Pseudoalteromonas]|uniref:bifunctional 23S rRNA (guanine(2069)-N(7))-methyltransferase RlmK/23S rRNA (guanine(2445)-N(2))-methyltransferase RlmL n=1 Tax=unclassified Pseudoalteromonas TaxID=194690 RepID=UPI001600000F|nr:MULTISPECIES: bifunctional 23S rRNA (guanine(2069)-N(7))-methyltransferase RlmK/23S rRNA (guanine(2445)-N(2))-methyltransferase RlmL [unclassified Pseudoalteromonas]MBB1300375.1 bifunctional 23S rRNA (guanine(2069)-N(7))-methyltransferase RlmK/23S rRNA (guanine(2445)-N(2))-methyltransferase RlmL [Pseudoalteromonas sp. SR44-8]MBB1397399.1 bifunctional 23S rRNA (guanine(2069)-N(7))-methyltransferase RlmK/23S rRNA (guanine(2445)-N(2))-methyltransferase RlmL [Pseudoalteromonas sp. SG44-8]MBB14090
MHFIALTSIGIENLLVDELTDIGATVTKQTVGSVRFDADTTLAQKVCLMSRFATRVLMLIEEKEGVNNKESLYNFARSQPWQEWFGPTQTFAVDFNGTNDSLKNTQFSGLVIKDAIVDYFNDLFEQRPNVDKQDANVRVVARLSRQGVAMYIDYSGPRLSERGYREGQGKAPIKEHLAAALIKRSGWLENVQQPLFDPCCGAGTILIEAAGMARNEAPGLFREGFAFERLPSFRIAKYKELKEQLTAQITDPKLWLIGHDNDANVLSKAVDNARRADLGDVIKFKQSDATKLTSVAKLPGVVISNLPYGERIGSMAELVSLHSALGTGFKKHFNNWKLALLGMDESLFKLLKLVKLKRYKFKNGPLDVVLNLYQLDDKQVSQTTEDKPALNFEGSMSFANRVKKNKQGLKNWLKQNDVQAYRVYDADIPEYNVAVDIYGDSAVIFEYAAPKEIDDVTAHKRLQDVISLTSQQLNIAPGNIAVKVRKKQKGEEQYTPMAKQNRTQVVEEFGAKFKVNLFDYLDTGLFLDHRLARRYIQENAKDKRFLNLFAYTGTASVHAALGGAKAITTVDLSKTYLKWGQDNFDLNNISNTRYRFEQADCLKWLEHATSQYDLIFLDPPTFSNSKRMKDAFDVQNDHIKLLTWVKKILSPSGTLIFSNNMRGFTMDEVGLIGLGLKAVNISEQTISPDFKRNKKIHNSWLITHG